MDEQTEKMGNEISPPAWGWPAMSEAIEKLRGDFPTRVGMARAAGVSFISMV